MTTNLSNTPPEFHANSELHRLLASRASGWLEVAAVPANYFGGSADSYDIALRLDGHYVGSLESAASLVEWFAGQLNDMMRADGMGRADRTDPDPVTVIRP